MSQLFDVLVAGEINPDLILSGDVVPAFGQVEKFVENAALTIGSSSAIFACGAARLGLKVAFIGICGALSTQSAGGTTAQATLAQAIPFLE